MRGSERHIRILSSSFSAIMPHISRPKWQYIVASNGFTMVDDTHNPTATDHAATSIFALTRFPAAKFLPCHDITETKNLPATPFLDYAKKSLFFLFWEQWCFQLVLVMLCTLLTEMWPGSQQITVWMLGYSMTKYPLKHSCQLLQISMCSKACDAKIGLVT